MTTDNTPSISRFRNLHTGQRCVIVCNGPSLNAMDLGFLRHEVVLGMNKIHLGLGRFGFYPRYLTVVNALVAEQSRAELRAMSCVKFVAGRAAVHLPQDAFTYHMPVLGPPSPFSPDIARGVREGGTVTHVALQIAYYMGFAEVVIIGMDHRYAFDGKPHQVRLMEGPDVNHFSPDYFSGQTWMNPDLARSETSYTAARRAFEAAGRRVVDATLDGACTVFDKADYRQVFGLGGLTTPG